MRAWFADGVCRCSSLCFGALYEAASGAEEKKEKTLLSDLVVEVPLRLGFAVDRRTLNNLVKYYLGLEEPLSDISKVCVN